MAKNKISEKDLEKWDLISQFTKRLKRITKESEETSNNRTLQCDEYFGLYLFGLLNPVVDSMRGLCQISDLSRVSENICSKPVSLASFSEAQHVYNPELLEKVFKELHEEASLSIHDSRLKPLKKELCAIDGTLLPALPRMMWACWVDEKNKAAKLHLKYSLLTGNACGAVITTGNESERKALKKLVNKNQIDVGDRGYGLDYGFIDELNSNDCGFVFRIRNDAKYEVLENYSLNPQAIKAGIKSDQLVKLGSKSNYKAVRLVIIEVAGKRLLLVSNQLDIDADLIALIYKFRWQVELYFKWFKCILGCRHWFAESPEGVKIQVYLALIAGLLLSRLIGKKPTKRQMEMIRFYLMGYATLDELILKLNLKNRE